MGAPMVEKKVEIRKIKHVRVVPHDPTWVESYRKEAHKLATILGSEVTGIYHAGSTSIRGIKAKPVVDILVAVRDIQKIDGYDTRMTEAGYEAIGELGISGRRFFTKTQDDTRTHNIHIFQYDHPEVEQMLNFRDYLRTFSAEAQRYSRLKEELSAVFPEDIDAYTAGKSSFIREVIRKAKQWRQENGPISPSPDP
ncbi:MAG TPA: GrpB family protein [Anaerolineales bacterium]